MSDVAFTADYIKEYDLLLLKNGTNGEIWQMSEIYKKLKVDNRQYQGFEIPDEYGIEIYDGKVCYAVYNLTWLICIKITDKNTHYLLGYNEKDKILTDDICTAIYEDIKICLYQN